MSSHKVKQFSPNKQIRLKAKQYLNFTFYKAGRIYYKSVHQAQNVDLMRKTQTIIKPKRLSIDSNKSPSKHSKQSIKRRKSKHSVQKDHIYYMEKSPYLSLSNAGQVEKMLKFLVPVSGPNQSVRQQIKRHNYLNFRNAQLLIVKKSQNFKERMKAYSSRMGLPQNSKIFTMNSKDKHIKDALTRRGWIESLQQDSVLFHLKWVYKDNISDYTLLQQGQFYNHFKNNQELTNKNYLRKNINNAAIQLRPSFPLSYDIDSNDDNYSFHQVFMKIEAYTLLHKIAIFLSIKYSSLYTKINSNPLFFCNYNRNKIESSFKVLKNILYTVEQEQLKRNKLWLKLQDLFQYFVYIAKTIQEDSSISYSIFRSNRDSNYSAKALRFLEGQFSYEAEQLFKYLSPFYIIQILKMWKHSQSFLKSYGYQNMWILKPTGVSRGSGITITNDMSKIVQLRFGKMVQKYIQNPLLLDCGRKFDLRQWVLVTSFQPLTVYAFKNCYARFSSQMYSNDKYQNLQKHLTNYSQNKQSYLKQKILVKDNLFKNNSQLFSAMSEQDLSAKIGPNWMKIKKQFYLDILRTLKCCKKQILQKEACFQVFGFDIILDQNYKPYILQVNMSPACEERQFLRNYLQQMADGIVNMIEGGDPVGWLKLPLQLLQKERLYKQKLSKIITIQNWWRKKIKIASNKV